MFIDFEDRCTLFDTLILCRFYRDLYPWEELGTIMALVTGETMEKADLQALAARVTNSARRFNLREGLRQTDDWLPKRLLKETLPDGRQITPEDLRRLVDDYYRLRGWQADGQLTGEAG